jgi:hypothetical protein
MKSWIVSKHFFKHFEDVKSYVRIKAISGLMKITKEKNSQQFHHKIETNKPSYHIIICIQ